MKQTHFIKNATSACVFLCVTALLSFASSPATATAADAPDTAQPRIYSLTGIVETRPGGDTPWQRLNKGDTITPNSTIATEPDAETILLIGTAAHLHIFGETELTFEELPAQTGGANNKITGNTNNGATSISNATKTQTAITLGAGQIYLSVSQLPTPDSTFTIKTPSALASVRGNAEFLIKLHDTGDTTLAVASGQIIAGSQGIEILLDPGYQTTIEPGMPPAEIHAILPMDATTLEAESRAANAIAVASAQSAPQLSSSADNRTESRTSFQLVKTSTNTASASSSATSPVGAHGRAPSATDTAEAAATSTPQFSSSTESESRTSFQLVKTSTDTAGAASNTAATTAATATATTTPTRTIESLITQAEKTAPKQNRPIKTQAKTPEHAKPTPDSGNTGKTNNDNISNNENKNDKKLEAATPEIKPAETKPVERASTPPGNQTPPPPVENTQSDEDKLHDEIADLLNELLNNR